MKVEFSQVSLQDRRRVRENDLVKDGSSLQQFVLASFGMDWLNWLSSPSRTWVPGVSPVAILWPLGTIPPRGGHLENGQTGADQCHVAVTAVNSPGSRTDSLGLRPMRGHSKGKAGRQLSHYRLECCPWDLCPPSDLWGFRGRWGVPGWPEHLHRWLPPLSICTNMSLPCFLLFLTTF